MTNRRYSRCRVTAQSTWKKSVASIVGAPLWCWVGRVCLGQTRAAAGAFYTGPRLDGIGERYGMDPQIKYFETACITDNAIEAILLPDPTR